MVRGSGALFEEKGMTMPGGFGFSYVGALFLLMLFVPNVIWTRKKPRGYSSEGESRVLSVFERTGEVMTVVCALVFDCFDPRGLSADLSLLAAAFALMVLYEMWWIRYFRSERSLKDFYSSFCGIPLAGAVLPVAAFALLGAYGRSIPMLVSTAVLGVGHIGIHRQHRKALARGTDTGEPRGADFG